MVAPDKKQTRGYVYKKKKTSSKKNEKEEQDEILKGMSISEYIEKKKNEYINEEVTKIEELKKKIIRWQEEADFLQKRYGIIWKVNNILKKIAKWNDDLVDLQCGKKRKKFEEEGTEYLKIYQEVTELNSSNNQNEKSKKKRKLETNVDGGSKKIQKIEEKDEILFDQNFMLNELIATAEKKPPPVIYHLQNICNQCGEELKLWNGFLLVCRKGHSTRPDIDTSIASMAYGDDVELPGSNYRKDHHFEDHIKKMEGKTKKTDISLIILSILFYLKDQKYTVDQIDVTVMREAAKALGLNDLYNLDIYLCTEITGQKLPNMTPDRKDFLKLLFTAIQKPYEKYAAIYAPTRTNFLSYPYALFKFSELLGWEDCKKCFNLLKGSSKLAIQDAIWEGICTDMEWKFIPSENNSTKKITKPLINVIQC